MSKKTFELEHEGGSRYCVMEYEGAHLNRKVRGKLQRNDARAMANEMRHAYEDGLRDGRKEAQADGVWVVAWSEQDGFGYIFRADVLFDQKKAQELFSSITQHDKKVMLHVWNENGEEVSAIENSIS